MDKKPHIFSFILIVALVLGTVLMHTRPSKPTQRVLSVHEISLDKRQPNPWVNNVFKDNILLNIAYLNQSIKKGKNIDWSMVSKPKTVEITLQPQEVFAYHEDVLPQYMGKVKKTTNAHFSYDEGFKSDGYLVGDGVCHLASLIYWAAKDAKLSAVAPTNHNFANVAQIPKEYGVSIYHSPGEKAINANQNLYVTNNYDKPVVLQFAYDGESLKLTVLQKI
ncbi:MAG: VanW family protein [Candidatus Levybacteria bacterium]|nr:VanW family protein [Candidatus Levybacteria bacterium]